jgi:hypothetical protein
MVVNPRIACVGVPLELLSGGSAKKARYREELPSTRTRRLPFGIESLTGDAKPTTDN